MGMRALRPEHLLGLQGWDALTHGVFWSLLVNLMVFVGVSMRRRPRLREHLLAASFLDPYAQHAPIGADTDVGNLRVGDLVALAERIVGERSAQRAFDQHRQDTGQALRSEATASRALVQFTERLMASAIGADSARLTMTSALRGSGMELSLIHI